MESGEDEEPMEAATGVSSSMAAAHLTPPLTPPHSLQLWLPGREAETDRGSGGGGEAAEVVDYSASRLYFSPHQQQVSMAEYHSHSGDYTQEAVRQLKASPEYKKHTHRCLSCGSVWYDGVVGEGCLECGGYAMKRPCPVCGGQCGRMWTRSTDMSRSLHEAHWNGKCALNEEQRVAHMLRTLVQPDHRELTDAMQDLGT